MFSIFKRIAFRLITDAWYFVMKRGSGKIIKMAYEISTYRSVAYRNNDQCNEHKLNMSFGFQKLEDFYKAKEQAVKLEKLKKHCEKSGYIFISSKQVQCKNPVYLIRIVHKDIYAEEQKYVIYDNGKVVASNEHNYKTRSYI